MWKDNVKLMRDYILKHSKVAFPVVIVAAVASTVAVSLKASDSSLEGEEITNQAVIKEQKEEIETVTGEIPEGTSEEIKEEEQKIQEVPLQQNTDSTMYTLMATYYDALANGNVDTIKTIKNYIEDTEEMRIRELSNYIESYPLIEIYTKPGPEENSYIAYVYTKVTFYGYTEEVPGLQTFYVCTKDDGSLYINEGEVGEDVLEYIKTVNFQDDVVELINRVNVECNEIYISNKKLFEYVEELESQVSKATGEALAARVAEGENASQAAENTPAPLEGEENQQPQNQPAEPAQPIYANATTTVNVRISDSEQAEKIDQVAGGEQVQIIEQRANGWSKVNYNGKEGYMKSEYLQIAGESMGTVTAITNVNIREAANESANKIGMVAGGDTVELLSKDNDWCQIRYNGLTGFVKAEYVE